MDQYNEHRTFFGAEHSLRCTGHICTTELDIMIHLVTKLNFNILKNCAHFALFFLHRTLMTQMMHLQKTVSFLRNV